MTTRTEKHPEPDWYQVDRCIISYRLSENPNGKPNRNLSHTLPGQDYNWLERSIIFLQLKRLIEKKMFIFMLITFLKNALQLVLKSRALVRKWLYWYSYCLNNPLNNWWSGRRKLYYLPSLLALEGKGGADKYGWWMGFIETCLRDWYYAASCCRCMGWRAISGALNFRISGGIQRRRQEDL